MNSERFRQSPAGRLLKVGQGETGYWAFVPNPLPPAFSWDSGMVRLLSDADRALGELSGLGRTLPNPHLLIGPFIRREAVFSSRIEGTQTNLADLYAYEAGQPSLFPEAKPPPPEAYLREVGNYVKAMEYGLERLKTLPVSLRLIRELHERLMTGVRGEHAAPGEFRHSQNWIGPPGCTLNEAEFVPPPVPEMQEGLDAFEKYLHRDDPFPPLIRLAFIHYQFEALHPFVDGNGRIGRLLVSLLMVNWNLLPLPLLYLSAFFEANRQAYYDLLFAVSARGTWLEWLRFFLQGVAEQARDAGARAKRLQDLQNEWHRRLAQDRSAGLLFRLVDSLFISPVVTISQAQRLLGVTYRSAKLNVEKLAQAGILRQTGESTYGKTYLAEAILQVIS